MTGQQGRCSWAKVYMTLTTENTQLLNMAAVAAASPRLHLKPTPPSKLARLQVAAACTDGLALGLYRPLCAWH